MSGTEFLHHHKFRRICSEVSGFTLIELVITMAITLTVLALLPPLLETTTTASDAAKGTATAQAQVSLAIQNLDNQISSAIQVCAPTQLTNPSSGSPVTVAAGYALRVEQVVSLGQYQWEQWEVTGATLQEEHYVPGQPGGSWVTVSKTVFNAGPSQAPFDVLPTQFPGSPIEVQIALYVSERPGRLAAKLETLSAASAYSSPEGTTFTPLCTDPSAAPTS